MECRSCLNDPTVLIVADTSVAINLCASGFSETILSALPNRVVVTNEVRRELEIDHRKDRSYADALSVLVRTNYVEVVHLGNAGLDHFTDLVMGSAEQTIDDGEAATIAYSLENGATALIDERKATRICENRFSTLSKGCTIDVFLHGNVQAALGPRNLADAVFNALIGARMRVLSHHLDWVVQLIGVERAACCLSLPRSVRGIHKPRVRIS